MLNDSFKAQPDYLRLLSNMSLAREERLDILDRTLRGQVHPYVLNFCKILLEKGLLHEFSDCAKAYRARYLQDNGIVEAKRYDNTVQSRLTAIHRAIGGQA